ncbi:complement component [Lithospermum erythrorhizon]|uniref:Complement component n=1 Tax=Lithospermum erythrorhizon TaxID=34254 RepID=A0AAV3RL82_LITER
MAHCIIRQLHKTSKPILLLKHQNNLKPIITNTFINNLNNCCYYTQKTTLIPEMHKNAFEDYILRLLRYEIRYEMETSPPYKPVPEFNSFNVDERPTEQWIRLTRKFNKNEEIKVEVTMFDACMPVKKPGVDEDMLLHVSMLVDICKGEGNDILEFVCSVWPDSIEIHKVYMRNKKRTGQPYMGPGFKELDDDLQNSLYEYLEERGIDEELATFLHKYMKNKDKSELLRWMERVKCFIETN